MFYPEFTHNCVVAYFRVVGGITAKNFRIYFACDNSVRITKTLTFSYDNCIRNWN